MATFGKTAIGGLSAGLSGDYAIACGGTGGYFTLTEDGDVTKISIYGRSSTTDNKKACIYAVDGSGNPTTLKGVSAATSVADYNAWWEFTFSPAVSLTTGNYRLGWNSDVYSFNVYYDAGDANATDWKGSTYPAFPDPFGTPDGGNNREHSIYATYTPAAAAGQPYISRVQGIAGMRTW